MSAAWGGGVIFCLRTRGIGGAKGGEIITDKKVTFSSRQSHRQRKTHKRFLSYRVCRHSIKMDLCEFPGGDPNLYLV